MFSPARRFHEEVPFHRDPDRLGPQAGRRRRAGQGHLPAGRHQRSDLLQVEVEVRRPGGLRAAACQGPGSGERQAQADVRRAGARQRRDEGSDRKKTVGPEQKREAVRYLVEVHTRPLSRSCDCVGLSRAAWYQPPVHWTVRDAGIIAALAEVVENRPSRGFWKCCKVLRRARPDWNHKRIYRVYKAMKLNLRRKAKQRLPKRERVPPYVPLLPDARSEERRVGKEARPPSAPRAHRKRNETTW